MSFEHRTRGWRLAAGTALGAVLALSLSALPASAAPSSLVDGDTTGSITVHKFERPSTLTNLPANGTEVQVPDTLVPLPDVTFTVAQINNIDLTTNAGWAAANALADGFDAGNVDGELADAGLTQGTPTALITDADGVADFSNLPVGLYLVSETLAPAGVIKSAPFLVTIPLTDPDNLDSWLYDVHVYPKNAVTRAGKTVADSTAVKFGDDVVWSIQSDIPTLDVIDGYRVADVLDPALEFDDTDASAVTVELSDGTELADTDYTVEFDAATNTVSVTFTDAGLLVLAENNTASVITTITTTAIAAGEIENTALIYSTLESFDIAAGEPGGPLETESAITKWGGFTLAKVDQNQAALTGAEFSIYAKKSDALAGTNPITLGGDTVFAVDAAGKLTLDGLRYSDWANGAEVAAGEAGYIEYFLVEVTAPEGYELLAEPVSVIVDASTTAVGVDHTVTNVESNAGFTLPLTGGTGTALLYAAGVLLLGGAVLLFVRLRRAQK